MFRINKAPLPMGFPRQEYWSGYPFPSPGDLPDRGTKPGCPALWADSLPSDPSEKQIQIQVTCYSKHKQGLGKVDLRQPGPGTQHLHLEKCLL